MLQIVGYKPKITGPLSRMPVDLNCKAIVIMITVYTNHHYPVPRWVRAGEPTNSASIRLPSRSCLQTLCAFLSNAALFYVRLFAFTTENILCFNMSDSRQKNYSSKRMNIRWTVKKNVPPKRQSLVEP